MRLRSLAVFFSFLLLTQFIAPLEVRSQRRSPSLRAASAVATIPAPEEVLGFRPGDDRKLASWNQVLTYFEKLDQASDRVKVQALGKSTMDAPFVLATISAAIVRVMPLPHG